MAARRNPKRTDPARTARLQRWIDRGFWAADIARIEGVSRAAMHAVLKRHGLTTNRGSTMNDVARPERIPALTAEQRIRIAELIAAGHFNDLVIAQHTGAAPEQVEAIRSAGQTATRKKPR
jgi:hypothetical protein